MDDIEKQLAELGLKMGPDGLPCEVHYGSYFNRPNRARLREMGYRANDATSTFTKISTKAPKPRQSKQKSQPKAPQQPIQPEPQQSNQNTGEGFFAEKKKKMIKIVAGAALVGAFGYQYVKDVAPTEQYDSTTKTEQLAPKLATDTVTREIMPLEQTKQISETKSSESNTSPELEKILAGVPSQYRQEILNILQEYDVSANATINIINHYGTSNNAMKNVTASLRAGKSIDDILLQYGDIIEKVSRRTGVDKRLIAKIIREESNGNPHARSHKNAQGLMQLLPGTARQMAHRRGMRNYNIWDPETNIELGTEYLVYLTERKYVGNRTSHVVMAYHDGEGTFQRQVTNKGITLNEAVRRGSFSRDGTRYLNRIMSEIPDGPVIQPREQQVTR